MCFVCALLCDVEWFVLLCGVVFVHVCVLFAIDWVVLYALCLFMCVFGWGVRCVWPVCDVLCDVICVLMCECVCVCVLFVSCGCVFCV